MPSGYRRQHLRIDHFVDLKPYKRPNRMVPGRDLGRETERHAESLKRDLAQAWAGAEGILSLRDAQVVGEPGRYIEFETLPEQPLPDLNWTSKGIRLASVARSDEGATIGTIFVPDAQQEFLDMKIDEYQSKRGKSGRPSHEARFASIEHFRLARLESLWVDARPMPAEGAPTWWEC
ncbi:MULTISPECIES: hypothetical protein [Novosphingobium]|uniref:Uncharacterized protein n=3 Tax=Sphingomonadaceae TaxID=41297 RepID=A0ABY1QWC0_9SPHN|nr:hypothetical protein [Novosphingobium panipatense]SMP82893.1 hypothetical protein SAMN06296065_1317 [Novosphingobium panipatense]